MTATVRCPPESTGEAISETRFDEVVRQYQRRVYRFLYVLVRDADAADTLTQECFLRAYQKWSGFRGECSVKTWLLQIALNLARDHGKNRKAGFWKRLVGLDDETTEFVQRAASDQPSADRVIAAKQRLQAVWGVVGALPEQQRTIFLLRFAEEMTLEEVAGLMGLSVGTVKAHLFRATGKVRERLKESHGNCSPSE